MVGCGNGGGGSGTELVTEVQSWWMVVAVVVDRSVRKSITQNTRKNKNQKLLLRPCLT